MSQDKYDAIDDLYAPPVTGAEHLDGDPDAKAKAEAKEEKRAASIRGRIKSIYDLGEGKWWLAESFKKNSALMRYPDGRLMMPQGKTCILVGKDGVGKSRILNQLCLSVATGRKFLDHFIPEESGRVLYICGEEDVEEMQRRLFYALKDTDIRTDATAMSMVGKNLRLLSQIGVDSRLQDDNHSETAAAKELLQTVKEMAELDGPFKLIILDPMSWFAGNEAEKDSSAATQFIRICQTFSLEIAGSPTVVVCHHNNKAATREARETEDADTTDIRGSSALSAAFRCSLNIVKLKSPTGEDWEGDTYLRFLVKKNNYGPEDHTGIHLRIVDPGVVRKMNADEVLTFEKARAADKAKAGASTKAGTSARSSYGRGNRSADAVAGGVDDGFS